MPRPPDKKSASKSPSQAKPPAPPAKPRTPARPRVPFAKKNAPPSVAEFAARLPVAVGKRFEGVRSFLLKQKGLSEELHFYGPKSGWGLRYVMDGTPLCALFIHGDGPLGIVSLAADVLAAVDWSTLSPVAQKARRLAHGSPALLWLDVPLDNTGAADFRAVVRAKLSLMRDES